jgi:hypothetical protein
MLMETKTKHGFDGHPPEFAPARDLYAVDRNTGHVVREVIDSPQNVNHSRIRKMLHYKRLTPRQAAAGERYERDAQAALMLTVATAGMVRTQGGWGQSVVSDARLDAQARDHAARAVLGTCQPVVDLVVLHGHTVEMAAAILKVHHQKAAGYLECGLDRLADALGLPRDETTP